MVLNHSEKGEEHAKFSRKKGKKREAEKGLRPSRGREIEFHIGK